MDDDQERRPVRPWKEIAAEMSKEKSSKRILELSLELEEAFRVQGALPPSRKK